MPPKLPPSPGKDARLLERSRRGEELAQQRRLRAPELGGMIMESNSLPGSNLLPLPFMAPPLPFMPLSGVHGGDIASSSSSSSAQERRHLAPQGKILVAVVSHSFSSSVLFPELPPSLPLPFMAPPMPFMPPLPVCHSGFHLGCMYVSFYSGQFATSFGTFRGTFIPIFSSGTSGISSLYPPNGNANAA
jgi:hypothetical protein